MATSFPTTPLTPAVRRPFGVTIVTLLTWLVAVTDIAAGIAFAANAEDRSVRHDLGMTETELRSYGVALIVVGVLTALVAIGLGRGSRLARALVAFIMVLHVGGAVYALTQISWEDQRNESLSAIWQIAISGLILFVLFGNKADRFFEQRR